MPLAPPPGDHRSCRTAQHDRDLEQRRRPRQLGQTDAVVDRARSRRLPAPAWASIRSSRTRSTTSKTFASIFTGLFLVLGSLLDRGRHPADRPDLHDAGGGAAQRDGDGPRGRHATPATDPAIRRRRLRLRDARRSGRRRRWASRPRSASRTAMKLTLRRRTSRSAACRRRAAWSWPTASAS